MLTPSTFWARIEALEHSKSANVRRGTSAVRQMIEEGYAGFTSQQWVEKTGMLMIEFASFRNRLFENQLIVNEKKCTTDREAYYRFTLDGLCSEKNTATKEGLYSRFNGNQDFARMPVWTFIPRFP